jgi:hypothetical protein
LTRRSAWAEHEGPLPIIEGTVIRLRVDHLPSGGDPKPVWLWWSKTDASPADVDRCWQAFLRRFDIEHTFRLFKQTLGWTVPQLRSPDSADRVDLAGDRCLHPATAGPAAGEGSAASLGETAAGASVEPGSGPARVSQHPGEDRFSSECAETQPAWSGAPAGFTQQVAC